MEWERYLVCPFCDAEPGQPCLDMRFTKKQNMVNDTPHRGRPVKRSKLKWKVVSNE